MNPFWIGPGSNPDIHSERVATNRLRILSIGGMIFERKIKTEVLHVKPVLRPFYPPRTAH